MDGASQMCRVGIGVGVGMGVGMGVIKYVPDRIGEQFEYVLRVVQSTRRVLDGVRRGELR